MKKTFLSTIVATFLALEGVSYAGSKFCDEYENKVDENTCKAKKGEEFFVGKGWMNYRKRWIQGIDIERSNYNRDLWFVFHGYGSNLPAYDSEGKRFDAVLQSGIEKRLYTWTWNRWDSRWMQVELEGRLGLGVEFTVEKREKDYSVSISGLGAKTDPITLPNYTSDTEVYGDATVGIKLMPIEGQYHFRYDTTRPSHILTVGGRF